MKKQSKRKAVAASLLGMLVVMQQSAALQVYASTITNTAGGALSKDNGVYNITPDVINTKTSTGFRKFNDFTLDKGDVANFIYKWYNSYATKTKIGPTVLPKTVYESADINNFVAAVNKQINIQGVVNALKETGGEFASGSNLVLLSPNGVVIGPSGVINVSSLSVLTPKNDTAYQNFVNSIEEANLYMPSNGAGYTVSIPDTELSGVLYGYFGKTNDNLTFNPSTLTIDPTKSVVINKDTTGAGKIISRDGVSINAGTFTNNGQVVTGLADTSKVVGSSDLTDGYIKDVVFTALVNTKSATKPATMMVNTGTGIELTNGSTFANYGQGNTELTNTGANGIKLAGTLVNTAGALTTNNAGAGGTVIGGTVTNSGGILDIENSSGAISVSSGGSVTSNGTAASGKSFIMNDTGSGISIAGDVKSTAGATLIQTEKGSINVASTGKVTNNGTGLTLKNDSTAANTGIDITGTVLGTSSLTMENQGAGGINVSGSGKVENTGTTIITNNGSGGVNIASTAQMINHGSILSISNGGANGINVKGNITGDNKANISLISNNSNVVIGDTTSGDNYITTNGDIDVRAANGNILNAGTTKTLLKTTDGGNLKMVTTDGTIGSGVTGTVEANSRDLTKSINTSIAGNVTAVSNLDESTDVNKSLINISSIDSNMNVNKVSAEGKVYLLADSATKGAQQYSILNKATEQDVKNNVLPNVKGSDISLIASGNIGESTKPVTIIQSGNNFNSAYNGQGKIYEYTPNTEHSVAALSNKGDINIKVIDTATKHEVEKEVDGIINVTYEYTYSKNDTNVSTLLAKDGNVNAEFSGNVYVDEASASDEVNLTTRGKYLVVNDLGDTTMGSDYFGATGNPHPTSAKLTALDLLDQGSSATNTTVSDSTIAVKKGTLKGTGAGRPSDTQDLTLVADHAYAGGYEFFMGKDRNQEGKTYYTENEYTQKLSNSNSSETPVSIRAKAVREEDVEGVDAVADRRSYYTGGSSQGSDEGYDGISSDSDDDNLVIPAPSPEIGDTDTDTDVDTDIDNDTDIDVDTDSDTDLDADTDTDTDVDNDTDIDEPEGDTDSDSDVDTDIDNDTDIDVDTDSDTDVDADTDTDTDVDNDTDIDEPEPDDDDDDSDSDTDTDSDIDNDTDIDSDSDSDTDVDADTDTDTDVDNDTDIDEPEPDDDDDDSDSDSDSDSDTDSDIDNDTDIDSDSDSDTDVDADTDTDTDVDNDTDIDEPEPDDDDDDSDSDTDTDSDIDNDTDIDSDSDSDTDVDADTDTDTDVDNDTDIDEPEGDTDSDSDVDTDIDNDTDIDVDTDSDTDVDADTDTDTDVDNDTDIDEPEDDDDDTDTDDDKPEPEPEPQTDDDTDSDTDTDDDTPHVIPTDKKGRHVVERLKDISNIKKIHLKNIPNMMLHQTVKTYRPANASGLEFYAKNTSVTGLKSMSAESLAVIYKDDLNVGDIVPVTLKYKDTIVEADTQVVSVKKDSAEIKYLNLSDSDKNRLKYIYMNCK